MKFLPLTCKSALNRVSGRFPFHFDLNVYRGCSHHCQYCYAIYSQRYLEKDFFNEIFYKENIVEVLRKELTKPSWKRETINLGGVCDSYQPIEKKLKLMPEILKLCIETKTPITISTKSDLILRDLDLIRQLAEVTRVNVAATITCMDAQIVKTLESGAVSPEHRFFMLKTIKEQTKASVGVHLMPIIPTLTDNVDNIERIMKTAQEYHLDYILPGLLYLRGKTKPHFLNYMHTVYPQKEKIVRQLYREGRLNAEYKFEFYKWFSPLMKKYNFTTGYQKEPVKKDFEQISLF